MKLPKYVYCTFNEDEPNLIRYSFIDPSDELEDGEEVQKVDAKTFVREQLSDYDDAQNTIGTEQCLSLLMELYDEVV